MPEGELEPEENIPEETEDQLVREIDVFFNPSVDSNTQLYVLQYPLRQCWRPYELDQRCEQVRVKPTRAEVEVDLSVDVDSPNFDPDADERVKMTKQVLSSSWKPPLRTGYAVGVLTGNKLHLSPVHAVVQLRPSMQHFKSGGSRKKNNTNSNEEAIVKSEELMEEKTVGPSNKQNKSGVSSEQDKDIGECWILLKYHGAKSDLSSRYVDKMVDREDSHIQFLMSPYDYLNSLCPGTSGDKIGPKGHSIRGLLSLPLEDRFKTWLLKGPPIHRFATLKHLAPNDSDELVLGVLQKLAQLVQGLWVPKSSVLYGTDTGVEILARNFILLLFSKSPVITREQLPKNPHPKLGNAMRQTLNMIAVDRPLCNDWKFKEPSDTSFIKLHRNVFEEQQQTWNNLEKTITEFVKGSSRIVTKNSSRPTMSERPVASADNRSAPRTSNGPLSMTPMTDETREALPKALQKLFQAQKVCSFNQICQRLRDMALNESIRGKGADRKILAAAKGVDAPQEELLAIINQAAINVHGAFVLKSSPDHPQYDGLRKIVIDLLLAEGPNAKLKKAAITEAAKLQLKRDITPVEYQKVLTELCVSSGSAWVLKRGDGNPV